MVKRTGCSFKVLRLNFHNPHDYLQLCVTPVTWDAMSSSGFLTYKTLSACDIETYMHGKILIHI